MILFKRYSKLKPEEDAFYKVELQYSAFHLLSGESKWFCRIWKKGWFDRLYEKSYGESFGKNKFEAYRKALINLFEENGQKY